MHLKITCYIIVVITHYIFIDGNPSHRQALDVDGTVTKVNMTIQWGDQTQPRKVFGKKRKEKKRKKKREKQNHQKQVKAFHCSQELMLSFCCFEHKGLVFRFSNHIIFLAGFEQMGVKNRTHFSKIKKHA